jgi:hypothetical protein
MFFKNVVIDALKDKELTLQEVSDALDLGKKKTLNKLNYLITKGIVERLEGGRYRIKKIEEPILDNVIVPPAMFNVHTEIAKEEKEMKDNINPSAEKPNKLGISEQVDELNKKLDLIAGIKKVKEKKFKLPGFNQQKLKRYNKGKKRPILLLRHSGEVELLKGEFMSGMVKVGENYYDASAMYIWLFRKMNKLTPFYIIPEWSIRPICRESIYEKAKSENTLIDSQVITLRGMKMEQVAKVEGAKFGGAMVWVLV